jgi:hypothetical protein
MTLLPLVFDGQGAERVHIGSRAADDTVATGV